MEALIAVLTKYSAWFGGWAASVFSADYIHKTPDLANNIPFISLVVANRKTPLAVKLFETGIMAAFAFGASLFVAVPMIKQEMSYLGRDIQKIEDKIDKIEQRVDKVDGKVDTLRTDIYKRTQ